MMMWMTVISPILFFITLVCIMTQRQHLLMALLALEAMILCLILLITSLSYTSWPMLLITILTLGACEASLGLACMAAMSRSYGNDHLHSLLSNKC